MGRIRTRIEALTGGAPATPLMVLFGLNLVDEFDRFAFAALTPEIRDAFDLSDTGIGAIAVVTGVFIVLAALPIGIIADRVNRVRLGAVAALIWGSMSVLTGLVPTVALLVVVRLVSGIGRVANEVIHPSLLNDYYDQRFLPRIFFLHRLANPLSGIAGALAGAIAAFLSWEWAFFLLAVPTFVLLGGILRLEEPVRGETIDPELAAAQSSADAVPYDEARRQLYAVPTLRRLWGGSMFVGAAVISTAPLLSLFWENVYGYAELGRGLMIFAFQSGVVGGFLLGLLLAERATGEEDVPRLATITGLSGVWFGTGLLGMVIVPWSWLSIVFMVTAGVGAGVFNPAYFPLVGRVAPPRVRSQAYAWAILYLAAGGLGSILLFEVGATDGYRTALGMLGLVTALGGSISWSARTFVRRDGERAERSLVAATELDASLQEASTRALLTCRGVEVTYGQVQVLFGADLEIRAGEVVALLGTNGAGKSTLLRAISGIVDPAGGAIYFDGRDITHADPSRTAALGIAQVPGGRAVFPTLTVEEHLRLAGWLEDDDARLAAARAEAYELFPALSDRRDQLAGNLSGGEQQMLGLAMAFVGRPRLLMIDELSLGLAPAIVGSLLEVVRRIADRGTAVLVVEQSVNVALSLAERAYFLEKGEVRFEGRTEDLLGRDDLLRSVFLEGASTAPRGRRSTRDATPPQSEAVVLQARELVRTFGGIRAVDGVDLRLRKGETVGIIGPNGAGKTTLFDLLSGYLAPDSGTVTFEGRDVTGRSAHRRAELGMGRSMQDARLVPSLTVAENLALSLERHLDIRDHVASALRLPDVIRLEEDVAYTVEDLIELMGLGAYRDKFVRELSTGTRRVVDLAMVVAHDPDVLLLDEPSSGIAQRETEALGPLLARIRDETGCALLVIEHDMPLITSVADRLVAMVLGRVVADGDPHDVVNDRDVVEAYLGADVAAIQRSGEVGA